MFMYKREREREIPVCKHTYRQCTSYSNDACKQIKHPHQLITSCLIRMIRFIYFNFGMG